MNEFQIYINKILKKTKLNSLDKKELEYEMIEHLNNVKDDYMKKGLSEKDAINSSIESFNSNDFLAEINNFAINKKINGISISYIFKANILLFFIYSVLMIINVTLFKINPNSNIAYFIIIAFILIINYNYIAINFQSKKDIALNVSIISLSFFIIEKASVIILSKMYSILRPIIKINIRDLYVLDFKNILIYSIISSVIILYAKYNTPNIYTKKYKLSNTEIILIFTSLILNIIYFLYPDRLYLLNLIISKTFNINVESFSKNLLYMIINSKLIIINIGLVLILSFVFYKFIRRVFKIKFKSNKFPL